MPTALKLQNLVKTFGTTRVVNGVHVEIQPGEMFFLLGASGCGKTTILRMVAGFYDPDQGDIYFDDRRMNGIPPHSRNTAMVFQNYATWPHLTVFENVAYGLRVRKVPKGELERRVNEALDQVQMRALADRKPPQLSGGQQQRVALARAMVVRPDVLLFDEPLCNLDAKLRLEMRDTIKRLLAKNPVTSLYVTHDQEEALSLASRIAVMNAGVIQQIGTPIEIYNQPANPFVASFIGEVNLYRADHPLARKFGGKLGHQVGFRPEKVRLCGASDGGVEAKVIYSCYLGSRNQLNLMTKDGTEVKASTEQWVPEGETVFFTVEDRHILQYPEAA